MLRWGLVPPWARTSRAGPKMINARMETRRDHARLPRPDPKGPRRALQLADGYFEWLKPEKARSGPASRSSSRSTAASRSRSPRCGRPRKVATASGSQSVTLLTCDSAPNRVAACDPRPDARDPRRPRRPAGMARSRLWRRGSARAVRRAAGRAPVARARPTRRVNKAGERDAEGPAAAGRARMVRGERAA